MKKENLPLISKRLATLLSAVLCLFTVAWGQALPGNPADFLYVGGPFCQNGPNVTPSTSSVGVFSEATGNIVFVSNITGELNLALCQPGTWTVKHVVFPDSTTRQVTILATDNPSFQFTPDFACISSDSVMIPVVLGLGGGTFSSSGAGLVIDSTSGAVDVSASAPGIYVVSYLTNGPCPSMGHDTITIGMYEDPTFSYPTNVYCGVNGQVLPDSIATPGGTFSASPSGLVLNSVTGEVNLGQSAGGVYIISYDINTVCPTSSQQVFEVVTPVGGALFMYQDSVFCSADPDQFPIVLSSANIVFSSTPGLVFSDVDSGIVSISGTPPGSYLVTGTLQTVCQETYSFPITIMDSVHLSLIVSEDTLFAPTAGTNFQWYYDGQAILGGSNSTFLAGLNGLYEVRYDDGGCGAIASGTYVGSAEASNWLASSNIYPNPTRGQVNFAVELQRPGKLAWEVYGALGNRVRSGEFAQTSRSFSGEIDLQDMPQGTYYLRLTTAGGSISEKVVLMR